MGNASSFSLPRLTTHIHTSSGAVFRLSYWDLVDHILLLRQVSNHPEMTEKGEKLDFYVQDYCYRMSKNQIMSKRQQSELSWQTDWIWQVHRLHPIAYYNDCIKQIPAKKDTIIVPTFDIDLIWHTHMIYPMNYLEFSTALCGYLLDHDDSIASTILTDAYRDTAERWKVAYGSEYDIKSWHADFLHKYPTGELDRNTLIETYKELYPQSETRSSCKWDVSNDGLLDQNELAHLISATYDRAGEKNRQGDQDPHKRAKEIIMKLDIHGNKKLDKTEFINGDVY
ncbi:unnamed protein product [Rotaria socialis]|uniref:Uncharacterized protein n=1 Tax=Rotaria socialis TaxID=392032 RepID=A0A820B5W3_9BILA|nr:unnamed protein product [Rotaria socialis]CAF4380243.1 unnamed protein product [Rotaria socialis]